MIHFTKPHTTKLICKLEQIIGQCCFNPESYDGHTGEYGKTFRYPVMYQSKNGKWNKTRNQISPNDVSHINSIGYKFGANELGIGEGLSRVLRYLEQRFNLDFEELEKRQSS